MNFKIYQRIIGCSHTLNNSQFRKFKSDMVHIYNENKFLAFFLKNKAEVFCRKYASIASIIPPIKAGVIKKFLMDQNIGFLEGYSCFIMECRYCKRKIYERGDTNKIYVNMTTGSFTCLKCQICGTWQDFQDFILLSKKEKRSAEFISNNPDWWSNDEETKSLLAKYESAIAITSKLSPETQALLDRFSIHEINNETFEKYGARIILDRNILLLPIFSYKGVMVGLHSIKYLTESSTLKFDVIPRSLKMALFGYQLVNLKQDSIVITGSPLHTLAVAQSGKVNVVSVPQEKCLPLELLPLFERFKKVILWLDNNISTWHVTKVFAQKLNEKRCFITRHSGQYLTPLEAMKNNLDVNEILKSACPMAHRSITSFHSLRQDVYLELCQSEQISGVKWKRFPLLNKLLKGHRHGELTVFTGPTGSGKTTWMSEYSLDLCMQGVRTLWGSFEIKNTRLAKVMLLQFAQSPAKNFLEQYEEWADKFESLPLFFLTFHGPESVKNVLEAMKYAVYVHDIEHVIVDNLQFMLGTTESSYQFDRFWKQDLVIASFRQFATVNNCHVTLVIHPRKEDAEELTNMSIFGGAKATQEADNVLILQNRKLNTLRGKKYIQITKNRFDGELGIVPLDFDGETRSFTLKKEKKQKKTGESDET